MKQPKLVAAIIITLGIMIIPIGQILRIYIPELQQINPTEYISYLSMTVLGSYLSAAVAVLRKKTTDPVVNMINRKLQNHQDQNPSVSPPQDTTNINNFSGRIDSIEAELKQVARTVKGLQVFFNEDKKEAKPNA